MMQWGDPRLPDAFWRRCIPEPNSGCWLMLGREVRGYTQFHSEGRFFLSHRFAYERLVGELPAYERDDDGCIELDHRCRTRSCVYPLHLDPVTRLVNTQRSLPWHRSKLSLEQAVSIRARLQAGERVCALAREFGVGHAVVSGIRTGKLWSRARGTEIG